MKSDLYSLIAVFCYQLSGSVIWFMVFDGNATIQRHYCDNNAIREKNPRRFLAGDSNFIPKQRLYYSLCYHCIRNFYESRYIGPVDIVARGFVLFRCCTGVVMDTLHNAL